MNTYAEALAAARTLHSTLERLYAARHNRALTLTRNQLEQLEMTIENCACHEGLASVEAFRE